MSHILNHNRTPFNFKLDRSENWDIFLDGDLYVGVSDDTDTDACLSAYVDTRNPECVDSYTGNLMSDGIHYWASALNGGLILNNIGLTGMDNGTVTFDRDTISNSEFLDLLTEGSLDLSDYGTRLVFRKVDGNNGIFDYGNEVAIDGDEQCVKLSGGFFQSFFKSGDTYKILPTNIGNGWGFEFLIKPDSTITHDGFTLNDRYPENNGIFFYIGTRAENKWWKYYETDTVFERIANTYFSDEYNTEDGYFSTINPNETYFSSDDVVSDIDLYWSEGYFADAYAGSASCTKESLDDLRCKCVSIEGKCGCSSYFADDYKGDGKDSCACTSYYNLKKDYLCDDEQINDDMAVETYGGHYTDIPNVIEIETDNKFILFDRTCDGYTTENWVEGTTGLISMIKADDKENYFLLYHRGCGGLTADKTWGSRYNKKYDVYSDLYRNAFGLFVDEDGRLGYKYLVKNCDCDGEDCQKYEILSETTTEGVIKDGEWTTIHVKIEPVGKAYKEECDYSTSAQRKMVLSLYVNGRLKLVSKEIPTFNFRSLNDTEDKQEGVPFSISIGGGTQGLSDVVYFDYTKLPDTVLPLEREFGGSLYGYFKAFRFYTCPLGLDGIRKTVIISRKA